MFSLSVTTLANYAFHQYAALEMDMVGASRFGDTPKNYEELILTQFMYDFVEDAKARGLEVDLSRISYKIHDQLGRDQAFYDRQNLTVMASCEPYRKHLQFLKSEIRMDNLLTVKTHVYHELGHCILRIDHDDFEFNQNMVPNIMAGDGKATLSWDFWLKHQPIHWTLAVDNLFNKAKAKSQ